jgi:hypothetical protein
VLLFLPFSGSVALRVFWVLSGRGFGPGIYDCAACGRSHRGKALADALVCARIGLGDTAAPPRSVSCKPMKNTASWPTCQTFVPPAEFAD